MEKSVFKTTVFILGAFFGVASAALASGSPHPSHQQADPRTWDQVRNLHHADEQADARTWDQVRNLHHESTAQADPRTWDQIRDIHHEAETAAADARTWYQVRPFHRAEKNGHILADN